MTIPNYASPRSEKGESLFQDRIGHIVEGYPVKKRLWSVLLTLAGLLLATVIWPSEPAKIIAISAFTAARFFDLRGRWSLFFDGIGVGDLLLYAASAGHLVR